jgi:hypothetical protein
MLTQTVRHMEHDGLITNYDVTADIRQDENHRAGATNDGLDRCEVHGVSGNGAFHRASLAHIRRIFARTSTGSRVRPFPLLTDFGVGQERLSKWSDTELGIKRVRCA